MKRDYITALLLTLCLVFLVVGFKNVLGNIQICLNEIRGNFERYNGISSTIAKNIQKLDELARENERLRMENAALRDMIEAFDMEQEQKYDFKGHQSRYMEGVR